MGNHNRYITPTLLDPLSQKTSTILEAACRLARGPRELQRYQTFFCATQADAGVVSRNIRKRKGGVKNPPNREFRDAVVCLLLRGKDACQRLVDGIGDVVNVI